MFNKYVWLLLVYMFLALFEKIYTCNIIIEGNYLNWYGFLYTIKLIGNL